ncbi:hypothetical protein [Erythrobacter aurantius]|uniref:hypothetical protein n=1 Tax=Erythrobacter aurantius TaxID=2909249 RepID=UPI002079BEA6|nr:hypothetical protein [Erythrobacter aurantius]
MSRALGSTLILMAITFVSKLIGFVRELVLLETLGIGVELDVFVVLYGLVTLVAGALGICIVTSLTPIAGQYRSALATRQLLLEGLRLGCGVGFAALVLCTAYVAIAGQEGGASSWQVALIVPFIVPFSLLAEYQVALFLSRDQRTPVIAGNLIISLPLVAALLVFDLDIVTYALGLMLSFVLRAVIFTVLLLRSSEADQSTPSQSSSLFGTRLGRTLAGGSAMLAIAAISVTAAMIARELGEGEATMIAYGLKVPQFVITSLWFVLGTGFFAQLVTRGTAGSKRQIAVYSMINLAIMAAFVAAIALLPDQSTLPAALASSELLMVLAASLPFLPLIVLTPIVEMSQRLLVTAQRHMAVLSVTAAILIAGLAAQILAVLTGSAALLAWSIVIGGVCGAGVACVMVARLDLSTPSHEASFSNVSA